MYEKRCHWSRENVSSRLVSSRGGGCAKWHILLDLNRPICTIERHRERSERGEQWRLDIDKRARHRRDIGPGI